MTTKQKNQREEILTVAHQNFEKGLNVYALFKLRDRGISQDLVQDTFKKTWIYLVKGGKIDVMKAFLYHILNNLIVDEYRKHKTYSLDVLLDNGFEPAPAKTENIADILDGKSALLMIQRLPPTYQKVMRMRYVQGLTLEEMSMITGQSKNTIAVQAHRGLERLKAIYHNPV